MKKLIKHSPYGMSTRSKEIGVNVSSEIMFFSSGVMFVSSGVMFSWDLVFFLFKRIASNEKRGEIFASSKFMVFCSFS